MLRKGLSAIFIAASMTACVQNNTRESSPATPSAEADSTTVMNTDTVPEFLFIDATPPAPAPEKFDLVFGDSNAHGMRSAQDLKGGTKVGNGPKSILDSIQTWPRADLKGKTILLTTGAGNNPSQVDEYVPRQLQYLKDSGVAAVVVMGISEAHINTDGKAMNEKLGAYARQSGFIYGGPILETAKDRVHAKNYGQLYRQAQDSLNRRPPTNKPR